MCAHCLRCPFFSSAHAGRTPTDGRLSNLSRVNSRSDNAGYQKDPQDEFSVGLRDDNIYKWKLMIVVSCSAPNDSFPLPSAPHKHTHTMMRRRPVKPLR